MNSTRTAREGRAAATALSTAWPTRDLPAKIAPRVPMSRLRSALPDLAAARAGGAWAAIAERRTSVAEADPVALPPVSVVIVNYNAGSCLCECVRNVLLQANEVIVVDNASNDDSLAKLGAEFSGSGQIKVIRNSTNCGFAAGCNRGLEAATQPYLMFLNPDCVLGGGAMVSLLGALKSDERVGMVGGRLVNVDGSEQVGGRRAVPTPWRSFVRAFGLSRLSHRWPRLFDDFCLHRQPLPERPIEIEAISGACMLVSRTAIERVGRWDEDYFLHCEDLDWCMRFRQRDLRVLFVPDALVVHSKGASSASRPVFVEWHKHRGMIRFYRKFFRHQYPGVLMWLVTIGVWMRFAAVAVYHGFGNAARRLGLKRG